MHFDIKPDNIMLTHDLRAKIVDFGLSLHVNHKVGGDSNSLYGTARYAPPDLDTVGKLNALPKCERFKFDVYSFGVVAMETFSRRPATGLPGTLVGADRMRQGVLGALTPAEKDVVEHCCQTRSQDRPDMQLVGSAAARPLCSAD